MTNSADPDQLASSVDLQCLLRQGMSCLAREGLREMPAKCYVWLKILSSRKQMVKVVKK